MKNISEEVKNTHLKHLLHVEETIFHKDAFLVAYKILRNLHMQLRKGVVDMDMLVSAKADGSPAIVFGVHPISGKFFVGTKSVFNKTPKINYNHDDIIKNHSHSAGLVEKLKESLEHLPKIIPKTGGIFQGDIMFGENDKIEYIDKVYFKPNTIGYSVKSDHVKYDEIRNAKFGIAIHTTYKGIPENEDSLVGMYSVFDKVSLDAHQDIHQSDLTFKSSSLSTYNYEAVDWFLSGVDIAGYKDILYTDIIRKHETLFKAFVNSKIRSGDKTTVEIYDYKQFIIAKFNKDISNLKSVKGKDRKQFELDGILKNINEYENEIWLLTRLHNNMVAAKNHIIDGMNKSNHEYLHTINDDETHPEGYVAVLSGIPVKLVHRHVFSLLNFQQSSNRL